jgi:tetratricopeptide (TPR) repeat protein
MDNITVAAVQEAFELLKAGKKDEAHAILVPVVRQNPDVAQAWYLLGFTVADADKRLSCFQQVLRIDPSNQAAQKQIARLTATERVVPEGGSSHASPFSTTSADSQQPASVPIPTSIPTSTSIPISLPASTPTPAKRQLSKKNLTLLIGIGVAVVAVFIVAGVTALYISNGTNLDQQVNALFAQRKCVEVVKYTSFEKSFPRSIFGSSYGVYHQIEECQAQLALEQAVELQDWPTAYNVIRDYILVHPNGAFVAGMSEQAGDILLSWSKILVAQNDYETAIEKLKLVEKFPTSSAGPTARKAIFDDYLIWAKYLFEQKDYQGAEKVLKLVGWGEKASPEQVQQANQGLAVVYLQWGKTEVENGKFDEGVQHYDTAKTLDPDLTDYDRLKDQVTLARVAALVTANDFDGALAMVKTMAETTLSNESKADAVAEEARVLDAYAHSDSKQAQDQMSTAAINMCKKELPTMSIFGTDAETIRFAFVSPYNLKLPEGWGANRPAELHYIVCIDPSQTKVETCSYRGGYTARRIRYAWGITLYDIATGKIYKTTRFQGPNPRTCGQTEFFYSGSSGNDIYGEMPNIQQIIDWLAALKIIK